MSSFYLLLLLLILCQETQGTKSTRIFHPGKDQWHFPLNVSVLPMMVGGLLQLRPQGAGSLPLPALEFLCWRSDAHASVDGTLSSHPAACELV